MSVTLFALAAVAAGQQPLHFVCKGLAHSSRNEERRPARSRPADPNDPANQVQVRLFAGDDAIKLPRAMLPVLRGGDEGWFKLKKVVSNGRSITARATINALNNPEIYINREDGMILVSGRTGYYSGRCTPAEASAPAQP